MATSTSGEFYTEPWIWWNWGSGDYKCRVKLSWEIVSTNPTANSTTIKISGVVQIYDSNDNFKYDSGRGFRAAQVAFYNTPYVSSGTNSKINSKDLYFFDRGSLLVPESGYLYNGYYIKDWNNTSYILKDVTFEIPHGESDTKDVYMCAWFKVGGNTWNISSVNNLFTLPTVKRDPLIKLNIGGTWKSGIPYVNIGGTWKKADNVYVNIDGTWKEIADKG